MARKLAVLGLLLLGAAAYGWLDLGQYLDLAAVTARQEELAAAFQADPARSAALFFLLYVLVTGLSLPGAAVLSLAAGAIFGLAWGTLIVACAAPLGATLAMLAARHLLGDAVRRRFGARLAAIDRGMAEDGALYLFTLRLVPLFPYFMVNLAMGLTPIRTWTFYWVSQLGMLTGTVLFVNAGTRLAGIQSPGDVLSPGVVASLALLGVFPLLARRLAEAARARRAASAWTRPRRFERNLVVIGAGSAGLVAAYAAAAVKARVTLVERARMGGDCLNTGCVPSKALIRSARFLAELKRAPEFGVDRAAADFDFARVMARVAGVVGQVAPKDSAERYAALGVEVVAGAARITSPWTVELTPTGGAPRTLTTRAIVIATGARPSLPPIPGLDAMAPLTSDNLWDLRALPPRLLVLGGGPLGCELAQCFARLGSQVTLVEQAERLLPGEDAEVSELLARCFQAEGITVLTVHRLTRFHLADGVKTADCESPGGDALRLPFDQVLVATGRAPDTAGLGLEELGIPVDAAGRIRVNEFLQTRHPNILACGDVAGPHQFTHAAAHQAWHAAANALLGGLWRLKADPGPLPRATFTDPEVARVGLNEQEARARGVDFEVTRVDLAELDRALTDAATRGFVKVLTAPGSDRILGVTLVGEHAGDLIAEFVLAMKQDIGLGRLLATLHVYPTLGEAGQRAAGAWRQAHAPGAALAWAERFHAWRRG